MNPEQNINREIELKIEITEEIYTSLIKQFPIIRNELQENYFFDTENRILNSNFWALRIRFQEGKAFLTAKGPKIIQSDEQIRPEYEVELPLDVGKKMQNGIELDKGLYPPINILYEKFGKILLLPLLSFTNQRIYIAWKQWILEIDKTCIGAKIFYELEIEAAIDTISSLKTEVMDFFAFHNWELKYSKSDKFSRAVKILL